MAYDEKFCDERHDNLKAMIDDHENRLNNHSGRLDKLEQDGREYKIEIKNLCKQVSDLVTTMKWFIGIWVTSLLGFFFYAVQSKILK
jgi:hypothetical protein